MFITGAQLYTVREFLQNIEDVDVSFAKVAKAGYKCVQASGVPAIVSDPKAVKEIADKYGLEIICTHFPIDLDGGNVDRIIENHKILGAKYAGLGALPVDYISEKGFAEFAKKFDKIAVELKKEGLGLTYHNHQFEFAKFGGKTGLEIMAENSECFTFLLDTYWMQFGGVSPALLIEKFGKSGRAEVLHFKDMGIKLATEPNPYASKQQMLEVGEGNIDWNAVITATNNAGIKYVFVEQDDCNGKDPFDCLETSLKNINKMTK